MKTPIVITAFGTTTKAVDTYDYMDAKIRESFSDHEIKWSYTSKMVRNLVKKKQKIELKSTKEVLTELEDEGYNQAVVQSLHVLCGTEFHRLINETKQCRIRTSIGLPLLSSLADYSALITGIGNIFSTPGNDEAVVLVGHGTEHPVWSSYIALEYLLQKEYGSNIYVGVVEGENSCDRIVQAVKGRGIKSVLLVPFMIVAGVHFKEDLIGDSEDSWKSRFEREGIEVRAVDKGLGYYPFIVDIFIDHIKQALDAITSHQGE
ncbi:MAG: sirohydrochlorin cobaltochelatase [Proteobacteria bacterium]|nr:sirohydrochlorin cobaltochelatase [Pseudomonadota bacterium]